jgi:hypothetical protein
MVLLTSYILWLSLKTGLAFGKWPGQVCNKKESPVLFWFCIAVYAFCFACSIYISLMVIKGDIIAFNWPNPPN